MYKDKYLKYKNKYIELKKILGGASSTKCYKPLVIGNNGTLDGSSEYSNQCFWLSVLSYLHDNGYHGLTLQQLRDYADMPEYTKTTRVNVDRYIYNIYRICILFDLQIQIFVIKDECISSDPDEILGNGSNIVHIVQYGGFLHFQRIVFFEGLDSLPEKRPFKETHTEIPDIDEKLIRIPFDRVRQEIDHEIEIGTLHLPNKEVFSLHVSSTGKSIKPKLLINGKTISLNDKDKIETIELRYLSDIEKLTTDFIINKTSWTDKMLILKRKIMTEYSKSEEQVYQDINKILDSIETQIMSEQLKHKKSKRKKSKHSKKKSSSKLIPNIDSSTYTDSSSPTEFSLSELISTKIQSPKIAHLPKQSIQSSDLTSKKAEIQSQKIGQSLQQSLQSSDLTSKKAEIQSQKIGQSLQQSILQSLQSSNLTSKKAKKQKKSSSKVIPNIDSSTYTDSSSPTEFSLSELISTKKQSQKIAQPHQQSLQSSDLTSKKAEIQSQKIGQPPQQSIQSSNLTSKKAEIQKKIDEYTKSINSKIISKNPPITEIQKIIKDRDILIIQLRELQTKSKL
jgi:hypothetical protein